MSHRRRATPQHSAKVVGPFSSCDAYVCCFSHLGAIGFVGQPNRANAWIARDMAETATVTPRLTENPVREASALLLGRRSCFKLFGVSEAAARLPSAVSALLATLA